MKHPIYVTADEAVKAVKTGDHIHLSSVASVPHVLIQALCRRADNGEVRDLHFHHSTQKDRLHIQNRDTMESSSTRDFSSDPM